MAGQPEDPSLVGRLSAFAETVLLIAGGSLAAAALASALGSGTRDARDALLYGDAGPQWLAAAMAEAQWLLLRFGLTLLLAWLICWWIGGPTRKLAGLSRSGRSFSDLIAFGAIMGVLLAAPPFALRVIHDVYGVGENTPFWDLMAASQWTPAFWAYMAVSSFALVPIVEELFFRTYALGRYRMHFSAGGAVLLCAALFWVSHGQYLRADPVLAANSALVFVGAAIMCWSVVRTGSVLPAIVAHAIFNIPMTTPFRLGVIALALVLIVALRRRIGATAADFLQTLAGTREWLTLAGIVAVLTGAAFLVRRFDQALLPLLAVFVVLALWGMIRRNPWTRRPAARG